MSRLDELIQELCPDGVKYKTIASIATVGRGKRVVKSQLTETGKYPVFQNSLNPLGYYTESNLPGNTPFIIGAGAAGEIGYSEVDFWAADDCYFIEKNEFINDRFLYHILLSQQQKFYSKVRKASIPRLSRSVIENLEVPVPPMEVQSEIFRILDNFTDLTEKLEEQLTEELTARKQQYEYYRDQVLTFKQFELKAVKDIADTNIGLATTVTKYKTSKGVLLIHNSDIQENQIVLKSHEYITEDFAEKNRKKRLRKDDIITVHTGDVGTSAVVTDKYDGAIGFTTITSRIKDKSEICPQYLCHYLNSHRCKQDIARLTISDRSNLNQKNFDKIMIPVPPMDVQRKIIEVLDSFEDICSNLSTGLPAEIEARQKQYEYYRDKLLTFKEKPA